MLYRLLAQQARRHDDRIAVAGEKRSLSFNALFTEATSAAAWLESRGCTAGDAVVLGLPPCTEFYVAFYAAAALGMVVLPVLPSGKIPRAIIDHRPKWAIGDSRFAARSRMECGSLRHAFDWGGSPRNRRTVGGLEEAKESISHRARHRCLELRLHRRADSLSAIP